MKPPTTAPRALTLGHLMFVAVLGLSGLAASAPAQSLVGSPLDGADLLALGDEGAPPTADPEWQVTYQSSNGMAGANVVVTQRHRAFVGGNISDSSSSPEDGHWGLIMAYDTRTGASLWSDMWEEAEPGLTTSERLMSGAIKGRDLVMGGMSGSESGGRRLLLRAYDAKSGERRWSWSGEPLESVRFDDLVIGRGMVIAAMSDYLPSGALRGRIRAFSLKTGVLLWSKDIEDTLGSIWDVDAQQCLAMAGSRVAWVGGTEQDGASLRVFSATTGEPLWSWSHSSNAPNSLLTSVVRQGGRFVVGGMLDGMPSLRSFSASKGKLLWTRTLSQDGSAGIVRCLALSAGRLVAAGTLFPNHSPADMDDEYMDADDMGISSSTIYVASVAFMSAFKPATGTPRWEQPLQGPSKLGVSNLPIALTAKGKRLAVLTMPYSMGTHSLSARVSMHGLSDGSPSWTAETSLTSIVVGSPYVGDMAMSKKQVVLAVPREGGWAGLWNVKAYAVSP
jgi:outer membrane protein assembly factor BamB